MLLFFSCYYHMAMLKLSLVWFGLYICPTKPKPVYRGLGKRKPNTGKSTAPKNVTLLLFLFISHYLNTEFEHKGVNTGGCHRLLK